MGVLTIDSGELLSHALDDGNVLTLINLLVMEKGLWSEECGDVLDLAHWLPGNVFGAPDVENGAATEAGGEIAFSVTRAGANARKTLMSVLTFNDGTFETDLDNIVMPAIQHGFLGLLLFKDSNNRVAITRRYLAGAHNIVYQLIVGGVNIDAVLFATASLDITFKLEDDGTNIHGYYDIGGGFVELSTAASHGQSIGTGYKVGFDALSRVNNTTRSADINYMRPTGTSVYWNTKADGSAIKTTYNEQTAAEGGGSIIEFGSAVFTEGANMTYDYKIGTGAWVLAQTSAQIIALGDQVTDNGKFNLRAVFGGGTSQASWTSFSVPTRSGDDGIISAPTVGSIASRVSSDGVISGSKCFSG